MRPTVDFVDATMTRLYSDADAHTRAIDADRRDDVEIRWANGKPVLVWLR